MTRVKRGTIEGIDYPPTQSQRVLRVRLVGGEKVYVPRSILELLESQGLDLDAKLTFIEKGFFGRTAWFGTPDLLALGVELRQIRVEDAEKAGWERPLVMGRELRHVGRGQILVIDPPEPEVAAILSRVVNHPELAPTFVPFSRKVGGDPTAINLIRAANLWLREPFEPFSYAETEWAEVDAFLQSVMLQSMTRDLVR